MSEQVGKIIVKTKIDNSGFETDAIDLKSKAKILERKLTNALGNGLKRGLELGGKAGRVFLGLFRIITKIGLGFIGIGGAIGLLVAGALILSQAFKKVFQENEQLKTNLAYIKFALLKAIEPAVNAVANVLVKIINFLIKIIQYTAYLIKAWTGYDMFKNATHEEFAKSMTDAEKSTSKTAKNAKEIKKQLAGFDEMNVLSDSSGNTANEPSGTMPSFDLSNLSDVETQINKIKDKFLKLKERILQLGDWKQYILGLNQIKSGVEKIIEGIKLRVKGAWQIITGIFTLNTDKIKEGFSNFVKGTEEILKGMLMIITGKFNIIVGSIKGVFTTLLGWIYEKFLKSFIDGFVSGINKITEKINGFREKIINSWTIIRDKIKNIITDIQNWLTNKFGEIGTKIGNVIGGSIKAVINGVLATAERFLNYPINAVNRLIDKVKVLPGLKNLQTLNTFSFPRLAKGGIINQPGRGVPLAYGGERGAEGVIPLTDSQQMALLGEAIGKYITINAQITNTMNGRVISREIQKVQNNSNFAINR